MLGSFKWSWCGMQTCPCSGKPRQGRIPFGTESKIMVVIGRSNIMDTFDGGQYCGQFQEFGGICRGSSRQASAKPCFWERVSLVEKNVKLC